MANLIKDIKTVTKLFLVMRKARVDGTEIMRKRTSLPIIRTGGFYETVEGCTLSHLDKEIEHKAQEVFKGLPDEIKHQLQFVPKAGEFTERVYFWRMVLKPVMTDKQYHTAMKAIISWYIHIIKMRKEGIVA